MEGREEGREREIEREMKERRIKEIRGKGG